MSAITENYASRPTGGLRIIDWIVRVTVALAFLAAGGAKLAGVPIMVELFDHVGIGQWFRYVTAACEIAGALLILAPRTVVFGAALLACVMTGGLFCHFFVGGGNPAPAAILLLLNLTVLWLHRPEVARLARLR